jgi:hypothetical protein
VFESVRQAEARLSRKCIGIGGKVRADLRAFLGTALLPMLEEGEDRKEWVQKEFDGHGMARSRSEARIAGDQWRPEGLGEPDVSSIAGREIVTELPNSRQERKMGVASDAEGNCN